MTDNAEPPGAESEPKVFEAEPARPVSEKSAQSREDRARSAAYKSRFVLVYAAMALIAGAAVGGFAVLLAQPGAAPATKWSAWVPSGSTSAKAKQIATRISKAYRLDDGRQLAAALVGPPQVSAGGGVGGDVPVRAIAIRPDTSTGAQEEDDIAIIDTQNSLTFILCGLGQNCSIASGTPSEARHALLQREALELALYTFKYVDDVNAVTVFLPPRKDATATPTSVFLRKNDVAAELRRPLIRTIGPRAPRIGKMPSSELATLNRITRTRLYSYEYQQAQDGSAILVLDPVAAST